MLSGAVAENAAAHVEAKDGVVTLSGTIASDDTRRQAIDIAKDTPGVPRVEHRLTLEPAERRQAGRVDARPDSFFNARRTRRGAS